MQAVLILAHKNIGQVIDLATILSKSFNVYIHLDIKASISQDEKEKLKKLPVNVYSKYNAKWGSYNIVRSTVLLMEEALKNKENTYFHLISGQDWPLESPQKIYEKFEKDQKIYMDYWKAIDKEKSNEKLIWWVKYYYNYDQINRRSLFGKIYHRLILLFQRMLRVDKLKRLGIQEELIYAGQEWVDIPREPLQYAINKYKNDEKLKRLFQSSFCSDEMWLQTILCNSPYRDQINKNINRFIKWERKHGSYPAILDEEDYNEILKSGCFWGRKFEKPISNELIEKLSK